MPDHIREYHQQTKHSLQQYARGPETIDWEQQPDAFRRYEGSVLLPLPLAAKELQQRYCELWLGDVQPQALTAKSLGSFFELSLALSAWKVMGSARWSVRANPSSGNLHPTEAYVILPQSEDWVAGVYHYQVAEHGLEQRALLDWRDAPADGFLLALSSVPWREAWKYGERAFRYCQLDVGHALMGMRLAAAALGWQLELLPMPENQLQALLGLDRSDEFFADEPEYAECLLSVRPVHNSQSPALNAQATQFFGRANKLDRKHFYEWPLVDEAFALTREDVTADASQQTVATALSPREFKQGLENSAFDVIRYRRSATQYNPQSTMPREAFLQILDGLLPRQQGPWDVCASASMDTRISLVFYVHRVEGMKPGLYALLRHDQHKALFQQQLRENFSWEAVADVPTHLPFYTLLNAQAAKAAATLSCHQHIAANSAFAVSMLAEFAGPLSQGSAAYRQLHWEAGMIGQVLYLEAENVQQRGTGIGCFFDDAVHETLGIQGDSLQVVYHFTVGDPVIDHRISSLPAYQGR